MAALGWLINLGFAASPSDAVVIAPEISAYSGGYLYPMDRPVRAKKFRAEDEQEKKAKPILEDIAENVDSVQDYELILRLRLRQQGLIYKSLYLKWLKKQAQHRKAVSDEIMKQEAISARKKRRRRDEEIIILSILH